MGLGKVAAYVAGLRLLPWECSFGLEWIFEGLSKCGRAATMLCVCVFVLGRRSAGTRWEGKFVARLARRLVPLYRERKGKPFLHSDPHHPGSVSNAGKTRASIPWVFPAAEVVGGEPTVGRSFVGSLVASPAPDFRGTKLKNRPPFGYFSGKVSSREFRVVPDESWEHACRGGRQTDLGLPFHLPAETQGRSSSVERGAFSYWLGVMPVRWAAALAVVGVVWSTDVLASSVSEQILRNKARYLFERFDANRDALVDRSELGALIRKTQQASEFESTELYRAYCDALGADAERGLNVGQLTEAYRNGYGDVESDWELLYHGRDGSEALDCVHIMVSGVPRYQNLLNGLYVRNEGLIDGLPYFTRRSGSRDARHLYWTPEYDGGWVLDDDFDVESTNAFLFSDDGRMAGTWAVADGDAWMDERGAKATCIDDEIAQVTGTATPSRLRRRPLGARGTPDGSRPVGGEGGGEAGAVIQDDVVAVVVKSDEGGTGVIFSTGSGSVRIARVDGAHESVSKLNVTVVSPDTVVRADRVPTDSVEGGRSE